MLSLVDKHGLLPLAWLLVGAVNAACPAAGPPLPFQQLFAGSLDPTLPRLWLFCILDPTNELVATKGCQALPKRIGFWIRSHGRLQIITGGMNGSMEKIVCHDAERSDVTRHDQSGQDLTPSPVERDPSTSNDGHVLCSARPPRCCRTKEGCRDQPQRREESTGQQGLGRAARQVCGHRRGCDCNREQ